MTKIVVSPFPCAQVFFGDGPLLALPAPLLAVWRRIKQGESGEREPYPEVSSEHPGGSKGKLELGVYI